MYLFTHHYLQVMSKKKILSGAESSAQVTIERSVLVTCRGCPFIVTPYFAFQTTRALFLALELLEGGNLVSAMHHAGGCLPIETVQFITAQIILGLAYLHKHGILYRDLKPLNIMLDRNGNAVLTDMGLCAKIKDSAFAKNVDGVNSTGEKLKERRSMDLMKMEELKCVGTFGFRAPEVLKVCVVG
jgi:serine/threonine protein kinase